MKITPIIEAIRLAFHSLVKNKLRSFLASLGVLIGISTVLLMGWLLQGLNDVVMDTINMFGVDILYVDKWQWAGGADWEDIRDRKKITNRNVEDFLAMDIDAEHILPYLDTWGSSIIYKDNTYTLPISGTTAEYSYIPTASIAEGRFFSDKEANVGQNLIVLGNKAYNTIFPKGKGIGKTVIVKGRKFLVVGYTKKQGTALFDMFDNKCYIPLRSFIKTFGGRRSYSIAIKAGGVENMDYVRDQVIGAMRSARNLKPYEKDDFSINETEAFAKEFKQISSIVGLVGIGITMLSFIVGIIGIMNIMFVSVTERTKEIGIRKAVGAKKSSIIVQFVVESSVLCFLGALLSYILCSGLAIAVANILPNYYDAASFLKPYLSIDLLLISAFVSIFVGVAAGIIPAIRASNLDPIESLRND